MTTLVAVGFPYETTASAAAEDVQRLACDLVLEADAVAVISCDEAGRFHVTTHHSAVQGGPTPGIFWSLLFSVLFFVPSFDTPVGADLGALLGTIERGGIDPAFLDRTRTMLQPGTSALFLAIDSTVPTSALDTLGRFGGTLVQTPLPAEVELEVQRALCGPARPSEAAKQAPSSSDRGRPTSSGPDDARRCPSRQP